MDKMNQPLSQTFTESKEEWNTKMCMENGDLKICLIYMPSIF